MLLQAANSFPKDIANKVRSDESLIPKGDKKAMQRVMPFLQFVAAEVRARPPRSGMRLMILHITCASTSGMRYEGPRQYIDLCASGAWLYQVKERGEDAMALSMAFDEVAVLTENLPFIVGSLEVPEVVILSTKEVDDSNKEDVDAASKASPGKPTMLFTWEAVPAAK